MEQQVKKAVCTMCHARCRVAVHSEKGRLVKIEEDRSFPRQNRVSPPVAACMRLRGAKEWLYHPDRVNFPIKRTGQRGEGKWQQVPWDEVFDEIAEGLQRIKHKYGGQAVAFTSGTGRTMGEHVARFMHLLGSTNSIGAAND